MLYLWLNYLVDKIDIVGDGLQDGFFGIQVSIELSWQECCDGGVCFVELLWVFMQQYEVIDIVDVMFGVQFVFDELVQFVQIYIGEEL